MCSPLTTTCEPPGHGGTDASADCETLDLACAANDVAGGAINVTAGGMFTADALAARDDVGPNGCGADGGRDLFYRVVLDAPQVYYFDTFGSSFNSVVRVYRKPCAMVGTGADYAACDNDACGGDQSQLAISLPSGESCIVIDQNAAAETTGATTLRVIPGGRDGARMAAGVQTYTGDTCASTNITEPINQYCDEPGSGGKDRAYFFTSCPGETLRLDANTCNATTTFDSVLYVKRVSGIQLACNDDACMSNARLTDASISNGPLYFLYVDGFGPTFCGPYQLDTNLRP